jgi:hypothetical protein
MIQNPTAKEFLPMRPLRLVPRLAATAVALLFAFAASLGLAQSVRWESEPGAGSTLLLVFDDCAPDGQPDLPGVAGVTFQYVGQSENVSIVNFQMTRSVVMSFLVRARQGGPLQIPAFKVKTNKGLLPVPAFSAAGPNITADSVAKSSLRPEKTRLWAGEVFALTYELSAAQRNNPQISQNFEWNAAPLVAEDWSKPEIAQTTGGERRLNVTYRTRAYAKTPNTLKLEAANHILNIQTGTVGIGFLSQPRMEPVSVTSDQPILEIRPLPSAPPAFSGAVGQFKIVSKVVPEKAAVGEPITWTIELSGTGNWPDVTGLPAREVSRDFQVVQPKAKRTPAEGKIFDVTLAEDVVLVPGKAGSYTLPAVAFTFFNPKTGAYETVSSAKTVLTITPPAAPQFRIAGSSSANESAPEAATRAPAPADTKPTPPPAAPALPAAIPRDPLTGTREVGTPLSTRTLAVACLAPFAVTLLLWLALALRRARATDPLRPQREARLRLAQHLKTLDHTTGDAQRRAQLLAWQHDAAVLWSISHAAPAASTLADETWRTLWQEADRAIYSAQFTLPGDWSARAQAALVAKRLPGFQPLRLFLPRNLLPFAAAVVVAGLASQAVLQAAAVAPKSDPLLAYRAADFANAEKGWRARSIQAPTDWIARHNLALALSQQERPTEALGHATAAFVQSPDNPSVRWHFSLAAQKAGVAPGELATFLTPDTLPQLAARANVVDWQVTLIASAVLAAVATGFLLTNAYGRRRRGCRLMAGSAIVLALLSGSSALVAITTYGPARHANAVIVARNGSLRSIPTEADATQKTSPLPAGTIALADQTFLGWTRLALANGQTGWVRKDDVIGLWR